MVALLALPLALRIQAPVGAGVADSQPVHVWLDASGPLMRGRPVHVYVTVRQTGNLVVLHRRTDGRIEPLFPANPTDAPTVHAGTYEIRSPGDRAAFVVSEPEGSGMVLAALASAPIWFNEFTRDAAWNPDALQPSWDSADAEGALSDVVQRMLGDGAFNYDVASYTVAPPVYAWQQYPDTADTNGQYVEQPAVGTCYDCTIIGTEIVEFDFVRFGHRDFGMRRRSHAAPPARADGLALPLVFRGGAAAAPAPMRQFTAPRRGSVATIAVKQRAAAEAPQPLVPQPRRRALLGTATADARSALATRYVGAHPVVSGRTPAAALEAMPLAERPLDNAAAPPAPRGGATLMARPMSRSMAFPGRQPASAFAEPRSAPRPAGMFSRGAAGAVARPMVLARGGAAWRRH